MKKILLTIAIASMLFAFCDRNTTTKADNQPENKNLISQIDYTNEWGDHQTITMKYDGQDRLIEMNSTSAEKPTCITYQEDAILVDMELPTKYEVRGQDIAAITDSEYEGVKEMLYSLSNGKVQQSSILLGEVSIVDHYTWETNCITQIHKEISEIFGENIVLATESFTTFTYGNIKNPWKIDVLGILNSYVHDDPNVGTFYDGFISEFLPETEHNEGFLDGEFPTTHDAKYEYVVTDGLVTEIRITRTNTTDYTDQDGGEVETEEHTMTAKITY